jgi:DNA helicase-2/ATP-dependent DNA helicase PcrA
VVHLAGLEDGLVPIAHARTQGQRAEEARLLYVAMTRAEDELRCTWAAHRSFGGKAMERRLTPWLAGLADRQRAASNGNGNGRDRGDAPQGGPAPGWQEHLSEQRAELAAAAAAAHERPTASPALAALHAWRAESARAARADPTAVIDDRLLELIAERRPATREELAAVPGMGPLLAARVGDGLLAALQPHRAS